MEPKCANCFYWQRDGSDGLCMGSAPQSRIMEAGKEYTLVWPRTEPDKRCPAHKSDENLFDK